MTHQPKGVSEIEGYTMKLPPTKSEATAIRAVYTVLVSGSKNVAKTFDQPDDDWMQVWMVMNADGEVTMLGGNMDKHAMVDEVGKYARKVSAIAVGHVASAWIVEAKGLTRERMMEIYHQMEAQDGSTEGIPERKEAVMLAIYTAANVKLWQALITRSQNDPPELGEFEPSPEGEAEGRMVSPIQEALQRLG